MTEDPARSIPRHELIAAALAAGFDKPEALSSDELVAALSQAPAKPVPTGWFGVARYLVANVIEQGLNLPQAARAIRNVGGAMGPSHRAPLPTVTLAQIYLGQGHSERARATLEEVLRRQPDNHKALALLAGLEAEKPEAPAAGAVGEESVAAPPSAGSSSESPPGSGSDPAPHPAPANGGRSEPARLIDPLLDHDEVVILRGEHKTYVCWELSSTSARRAKAGELTLLVKTFEPAGQWPRVASHHVELGQSNGAHSLSLDDQVSVRAALVWTQAKRVQVARVACEYACRRGGRPELAWEPRKGLGAAAHESAERAAGLLFV